MAGRVEFGDERLTPDLNTDRTLVAGTVGFDYAWDRYHVGVAGTIQGGNVGESATGRFDVSPAVTPSIYAAYFGNPFYLQAYAGVTPKAHFTNVDRPAAYGLTGTGSTSADIPRRARASTRWCATPAPRTGTARI